MKYLILIAFLFSSCSRPVEIEDMTREELIRSLRRSGVIYIAPQPHRGKP